MSDTFLFATAVLIWGSTWLAIEFQLGVVAPEVSLVYRFLAASIMLFIWCKIKGLPVIFKPKHHIWFALMGLLLFGLNYVLAYRAQIYLTSALSAIAFSTLLWMNIINSRIFFGVKADRRLYGGALLGTVGICVLFGPRISEVSLSDGIFYGSLLAVISALLASFGNMASQSAQKAQLPVVQSNAWSMLYGCAFTAVLAFVGGHEYTFDWSFGYVVSLAYLAIFGSVLAFGAYLTLLGRIGAHKAGYVTVMFPVVALILSILFEGLRLDPGLVAGTFLVLAGNLLVLAKRREKAMAA